MNQYQKSVRPSPIAGLWYSGDSEKLHLEINAYLNQAEVEADGEVVGLIAPHAGYRYSGKTAGAAFSTVLGNAYDLVIVLSPYHAYHPATVLSTRHGAYGTPLGDVPIDHDRLNKISDALSEKNGQEIVRLIADEEHSLEIELPFLQCSLQPGFKLLPLMLRSLDTAFAKRIAAVIYEAVKGRKVLVVASTDLSHFYPEAIAKQYDANMLAAFEAFSSQAVYEAEHQKQGFACGSGAVMVAMELCKLLGAGQVQILAYTTSAETTGDPESVVGYGSAAITKSKQQGALSQ